MYFIRFVMVMTALFACAWAAQAQTVQEDVVYLKNGSVVRGKVLEYKPSENIKIEIYGGSVLVYPATEVVEVKKEDSKTPQPSNNTTYTQPVIPKKPVHISTKGWYHYTTGKTAVGIDAMSMFAPVIGLYHASGYQFNQFASLGLGLGIERNGVFNMMPVYAEFRGYAMKTSASLFYSLGLGYNAVLPSKGREWGRWGEISKSAGGYYIYPALGVRFASSSRVHTVIDFGCTIQSAFNTTRTSTTWVWDPNTGMGEQVEQTAVMQMPAMLRPTIRVGVIF